MARSAAAHLAGVIGYLGAGLAISYYGAEVYGIEAIGERPWRTATPA